MWEQIGESSSKICKFMPPGHKKGKKITSQFSSFHSSEQSHNSRDETRCLPLSDSGPLKLLSTGAESQARRPAPTSGGPGGLTFEHRILC